MKIKIISGANLNMLGRREEIYGKQTYQELCDEIANYATLAGIDTVFFQSNCEGEIIDEIHRTMDGFDGLIINPGAYSHYSYAIADALGMLKFPKIEVHLTDILSRESFRSISVTAPFCSEMIAGKGIEGYKLALDRIALFFSSSNIR